MASAWKVRAEGFSREPDLDEARVALALLADPAAPCELFSVHPAVYETLPGADLDGLAAWSDRHQGSVGNFVTVNPLLADYAQRPGGGGLVDDFASRRWLALDVDPVRPEKDANATEGEREAARAVQAAATAYLIDKGAPDPVLIDTGNGWHCLYRVELPNDPEARALVARLLRGLAGAFDTPGATIDAGAARVTFHARLPGFWNRKGPHSNERPQRMARLARVPAKVEVFPAALLEELAGPAPERQQPRPKAWRQRAEPTGREAAYVRSALDKECAAVRASGQGARNETLNKAAFSLGQFVGSGLLDRDLAESELLAAAEDTGLPGREARGTIKSGLNAGQKEPRGVPEEGPGPAASVNGHAGAGASAKAETDERPPPAIYTLPQLLGLELPEPNWTVPGILSEGLAILAGKPKLGKSWMALNLAITIVAGGDALGAIRVSAGDVLYLSLEDRLRRVQDRARKVLKGLGVEASARLHVATEWPRMHAGGLEEIKKWMTSVPHPTLVVIDVWAKFRTVYEGRGSQYDHDYEQAGALKAIGDQHGCNVLALHHCKKAKAEDVVDEISGTLGLAGGADGLLILTRTRGEYEGNLFITGRDVEERELALEFDPVTFCWRSTGAASERTESRTKTALIEFFKANVGCILSIADLADAARVDDKHRQYLRCILSRMVTEELIQRVGSGRYRWPARTEEFGP